VAGLGQGASGTPEPPIQVLVNDMLERSDRLPPQYSHLRAFLSTYRRTTQAVGEAVEGGLFEDRAWVERWDVAFAQFYLTALDAHLADVERIPRPWQLAFSTSPDLDPLLHVLLGINAHVNYDLPQALLAVISDDEFADMKLMDRRRSHHERNDQVLASRVGSEDVELGTGGRRLLDRLLRPLNRKASKRFLREARQKVWHNTLQLHDARVDGPSHYAVRLAELELLSAAKIADLLRPGQVLLRLAVAGFGVVLPPPDWDAETAKG
jgi:hypothetical protein